MIAIQMQLERLMLAKGCLEDVVLIPNEIEDNVIAAKAEVAIKQMEMVEKFLTTFNEAVKSVDEPNDEELLLECITQMIGANNLIHLFRNEPEKVNNYAIQVDPMIRGLRVTTAKVKERLGLK